MFVTASSFRRCELSLLIHHAAALAPLAYLFTAIAFRCKWLLDAKFTLQGVAQIFSEELSPSVQKRWWQSHGCQIAWGTRREAASPELALSAGDQPSWNLALKQTPYRWASPRVRAGKEGRQHKTIFLFLTRDWDWGYNFIPALLELTFNAVCFLKGSDGLEYTCRLVPSFLLWSVLTGAVLSALSAPNPHD